MSVMPPPPHGQDERPDRDLWSVLRGCVAVLVLVLTALDALVTAVLGVSPVTPVLSRLRHVIADEYRAARMGAVNAEPIDDQERKVWR